jgi:fluoroquinolone transport system ATP-binding protein
VVDGRIVACDRPRALRLAHGERRVRVEHRTTAGLETSSFPLADAAGDLAALLACGRIETIHTAEASLDDVFAEVTGRAL